MKFVRQSGGRGQYGHVVINADPNEAGWFFKIEISDMAPVAEYMDEAAYLSFIK